MPGSASALRISSHARWGFSFTDQCDVGPARNCRVAVLALFPCRIRAVPRSIFTPTLLTTAASPSDGELGCAPGARRFVEILGRPLEWWRSVRPRKCGAIMVSEQFPHVLMPIASAHGARRFRGN